jgi:hypothetical protein
VRKKYFTFAPGEMSERFNEAVLKTVEGNTSGGSNPSLSAFARHSQDKVQSEGGLFVPLRSSLRAGYGGQNSPVQKENMQLRSGSSLFLMLFYHVPI